MYFRDAMQILSQSETGVIILDAEGIVMEMNDFALRIVSQGEGLVGRFLPPNLQMLCQDPALTKIARNGFGSYLMAVPAPEVEGLPYGHRFIVFRDANDRAWCIMFRRVMNQIKEGVVLADEDSRLLFLNDAAVSLDSIVSQDAMGERISDIYEMLDEKDLVLPQVLESRRPIRNRQQFYKTRFGKEVSTICNAFPIMQDDQPLAAVNIAEDLTSIDSLSRQVVDLQEKLTNSKGKNESRESPLKARWTFNDIEHVSASMEHIINQCRQAARSDSPIILIGETGTGKELFAQSIHNTSSRSKEPFLAINCAAIPDSLLESLLFGTEKGAFTGAERRAGLFEQANHGTLLLDEINSMDINLQSKLLRVLQEGRLRRVGGMKEIDIDVRVISNINIHPYKAIEEGKLRQDLYYRLGVVNIVIPPLRERKEDISLLSKRFIIDCNRRLNRSVSDLSPEVIEAFQTYDWPGNVRELQHAIEHAINTLPDGILRITKDYLPEHITAGKSQEDSEIQGESKKIISVEKSEKKAVKRKRSRDLPSTRSIKEVEKQTICRVLIENGGNISRSARELEISRQNLQHKIKRFGIDIGELLS